MSKVTYENLEDIIKRSTERIDKIHLVEVKTEWNGCSHINAPVIKKIENEFEGIIEVYQIDLEDNKNSLIETCFESTPSVLFIKDGIVIKTLNGTFSRKSAEKIVLDLLNGLHG
jgi:thioredoxin-like negative regulator of GroEL